MTEPKTQADHDVLNRICEWMDAQGYATGHGDSIADLLNEIDWQAKERVIRQAWK